MKQIDIVELKKQIKDGVFNVFMKHGIIYIEDADNGECVMVCDLDKVERRL